MKRIKLSKLQADFILHRLEVDDALHEVYVESINEEREDLHEPLLTVQEISKLGDKISDACQEIENELPYLIPVEKLTELQKWILIDCVVGSTYCLTWDSMEDKEQARRKRLARIMGKIMSQYLDRKLTVPTD